MSFSQFHPLEQHPLTGEPYIRLPAPFDRIIVTPPRQGDVTHIVKILNDYPVKKWLDGPPFPYLDVHAEEWIVKNREQSEAIMHELRVADEEQPRGPAVAVSGCPVGCLRGVEEDGTEVFLGAIEFSRCGFPDLLNRQEQERMASGNDRRRRGDPDIVWCIGYYLAAPLHRRGLMSCVVRTLVNAWVVPRMGARQIRVETIIGNQGSIRVLEKLGFRIADTVRRQKVTSAGEMIEGFHVLWWELDGGGR